MTETKVRGASEPIALLQMSSFQRDVLVLLYYYGPQSGSKLRDLHEMYSGEEVGRRTVYPNLTHLRDDGLVESFEAGTEKISELTSRGRKAVERYQQFTNGEL